MISVRISGVAVLFAALAAVGPAAAQMGLPASQRATATALREACGADHARLCAQVSPGGGRILACLEAHEEALTPTCRAALPQARALRAAAPDPRAK